MNASSNALVGELRKHPCGALGAGKQQRLAAGGSRGAHVARLASAGARGRSMEKNTQKGGAATLPRSRLEGRVKRAFLYRISLTV